MGMLLCWQFTQPVQKQKSCALQAYHVRYSGAYRLTCRLCVYISSSQHQVLAVLAAPKVDQGHLVFATAVLFEEPQILCLTGSMCTLLSVACTGDPSEQLFSDTSG